MFSLIRNILSNFIIKNNSVWRNEFQLHSLNLCEKTLFWTQCSARLLLALYRLIYVLLFLLYWSVKLAFLSKLRSWRRHSLTIWTRTPPSKSQFLNLGKALKYFKGYFIQGILLNILLNLFCVAQFSSSERYRHFKWDHLKTDCNKWWRRVKKIVMFYRQFIILFKWS